MYTLVDRDNGSVISEIDDKDFGVFEEHLVAQSPDDFDFYLNHATLAYLQEQGLSEAVVEAFHGKLHDRGMDMGWEKVTSDTEALHTGTVIDDEGQPLGGIRVDLLDQAPLSSGKLHDERKILDWTYTRPDGAFTIETTPESPGTQLRFSGRGDLVLASAYIDVIGDQGQFTVQTITGTVRIDTGEPLSGVSVQLLNWGLVEGEPDDDDTLGGSLSWGDTNEQGRFAIPAHLPTDAGLVKVDLEILAPSGENLLEIGYEFDPGEGFEIGELVAQAPQDSWGEEGDLTVEEARHRSFEHPLS